MGTMNKADKRAELLKELQQELDHRTQVEKANDLLATLDDEIVRQIERELDGLHDEKSAENSEDKSMSFSMKVYQHFGLDLLEMRDKELEHDWGICKKEDAKRCTRNMLGFGMEQSQQIIIDFDKNYGWVLIRRYKKSNETFYDAPQEINSALIPVPKDMGQ